MVQRVGPWGRPTPDQEADELTSQILTAARWGAPVPQPQALPRNAGGELAPSVAGSGRGCEIRARLRRGRVRPTVGATEDSPTHD